MIAGMVLDAIVAEKVMGLTLNRRYETGEQLAPNYFAPVAGVYTVSPRPYSTDIAAAWQVVEKLQKDNPFWDHHDFDGWMDFQLSPATGSDGLCWYSNFGDSTTGEYADTAPLAICLAALKAVYSASQ